MTEWHYWLLIAVIVVCTYFVVAAVAALASAVGVASANVSQLLIIATEVRGTTASVNELDASIWQLDQNVQALPDNIAASLKGLMR